MEKRNKIDPIRFPRSQDESYHPRISCRLPALQTFQCHPHMQFVTGSVSVRFPPPPLPPPLFFFLPKTVRSEFVNRFQQLSAVVKGKRVVLCVLLSFPRLRSWHENPVPSSVFDRSGRRWCFELEHGTHEKLIISSKAPRENGQKRKVLFFSFFSPNTTMSFNNPRAVSTSLP